MLKAPLDFRNHGQIAACSTSDFGFRGIIRVSVSPDSATCAAGRRL